MSAKLKVVDDSRGAREAHHGEALAFGVVGSNRVGGRVACDARKQSSAHRGIETSNIQRVLKVP
jgi:hypothetical protein